MEIFRLEYNKRKGLFHLESLSQKKVATEGTFGWQTISASVTREIADKFISKMNERFPVLKRGYDRKFWFYPAAETIRVEFESYTAKTTQHEIQH